MKVKELIELLQQQDPEREVIMSSDEEGNRFGAFVEIAKCDVVCANCHKERTFKQSLKGYKKKNTSRK